MDANALMTGLAVARELIAAGTELLTQIESRQKARAAEGRELTHADLVQLFELGDTQQRAERALLMKLSADQKNSEG